MHHFRVDDMTCSHCLATVEKAVKSVDGTAAVKIDLSTLIVDIDSPVPPQRFAEAIREAGYTPRLRD